jgi:hypothetical protein
MGAPSRSASQMASFTRVEAVALLDSWLQSHTCEVMEKVPPTGTSAPQSALQHPPPRLQPTTPQADETQLLQQEPPADVQRWCTARPN